MRKTLKVVFTILSVIVLLVIAAVAVTPTVLSTDFGRGLVESAASDALGRTVTIGRLSVGWFAGLDVGDVLIGERPGFGSDPFLKLKTFSSRNAFPAWLSNNALSRVNITGLEVNIVRLKDGRTSIDDLTGAESEPKEEAKETAAPAAAAAAATGGKLPGFTVPFLLESGHIRFSDEGLKTEVLLDQLHLIGQYEAGRIVLTDGAARLNEGDFIVTGELDLRKTPAPLAGNLIIRNAKLSSDLSGLGYQVPLLYNPFGRTSGTLNIETHVTGEGLDWPTLSQSLAGTSKLKVADVRLEGSEVVARLIEKMPFLKVGSALEFGEITADSTIAGGRVTSREIRAAHNDDVVLVMSGWTALVGGEMDYRISLSGRKLEKIEPFMSLASIGLAGTLSDPKIKLGIPGLNNGEPQSIEEAGKTIQSLIDQFRKKKPDDQ